MLQLATSKAYVFIPVPLPPGVAQPAVQIALMPDNGTEPQAGDWHPGVWLSPWPGLPPEPALLVGPGGGVSYPPGEYFAYVQLAAGAEAPVLPAGRMRIGDARD